MAKTTLDAGACGFKVVVKATKTGHRRYRVDLVSPCEMVKNLNKELKSMEFGPEVFSNMLESEIYRLCSKHLKHVSCPLPSAILKTIEVDDGLAVAKNAYIKVEK